MKDRKIQKTHKQPASKQSYEPPRASYVELKVEEKLLSCVTKTQQGGTCSSPGQNIS